MTSNAEHLLKKNPKLIHLEGVKVTSHVQRDAGEWIVNTLLIQNYEVAFKYKRKHRYRSLIGSLVNLTYYPSVEHPAGIEIEMMKVVRIRQS